MPPEIVMLEMARILAPAAVIALLGFPFARAIARRLEGRTSAHQPESLAAVESRLRHIEASVDAIALEMERVTEGQRFATKLLSERTPPPPPSEPG